MKTSSLSIVGGTAIAILLIQASCSSQTTVAPTPLSASPEVNVLKTDTSNRDEEQLEKNQPVAAQPVDSGLGVTPPTPGANILISVIDELGQPVQEGTVKISTEYEPAFAFYNDTFTMSLQSDVVDGLLGLYPPPANYLAKISIRVMTPAGGVSDALVVDSVAFWQAVEATESDYVGVHQFDLGKTGQTTILVFN